MTQTRRTTTLALALVLIASTAHAQGVKPLAKCARDAAVSGTVCMDKFEASVWRVPDPLGANKKLVKKIRSGKVTATDLAHGGATQLGTAGDDYSPCGDNGQNCANDVYAVSVAGVSPSAYLTWFQAQEACANAGKRLPTSAEWQVGANGTPDKGGADNGTTDCNTDSTFTVAATGSRSGCVSARGVFDMGGNLTEWVEDWVPRSTACPNWGAFSDDAMCISGASTTATGPGATLRGGDFTLGAPAGPLAVSTFLEPSASLSLIGFRCAR